MLGVRSFELEIAQFRSVLCTDRPWIQLLATLDDHHCSDGYSWPPIEVWRGVCSNWYQQGIDAVQTFNWGVASAATATRLGVQTHGAYFDGTRQIPVYQQAYHELGDPDVLAPLDKHFVVQRRGGGGSGGAGVDEWRTPRASYANTNLLGQLPAKLDPLGHVDTLLKLRVADDLRDGAEVGTLAVFMLLSKEEGSDAAKEEDAKKEAMSQVVDINSFWDRPGTQTNQFSLDICGQVRLHVNGVRIEATAQHCDGWLRIDCLGQRGAWAVGENLLSVVLEGGCAHRLSLQKAELRVTYAAAATPRL